MASLILHHSSFNEKNKGVIKETITPTEKGKGVLSLSFEGLMKHTQVNFYLETHNVSMTSIDIALCNLIFKL